MADIPNVNPDSRAATVMDAPDKMVKVRELFGIDSDMEVPAFSEADERVPDLDPAYVFDPDTTLAICAGFAKNRRVMVQGYHGTGKSTHIEQVAARLNWPTDPDQPRRPYQPHRPDRPRRDRASRRPAGHRVPRRACCPGRCRRRPLWCSTNMTPAGPT